MDSLKLGKDEIVKLYMTHRSPYARKVRIAMIEKGLQWDDVPIDLFNLPSNFLQKTSIGTVPTLEDNDGLILSDSTLILRYLEDKYTAPSLVPHNIHDQYICWQWEEMADRLCDHQVALFFEKQKQDPSPKILTKSSQRSTLIMDKLNHQLGHNEFIMNEFSIADIAFGATLGWMVFRLHANLNLWANIQSWLQRVNQRESFQQTPPRLDS